MNYQDTAKAKAREMMQKGFFSDEEVTAVQIQDQITSQTITDLLDELEKEMGEEIEIPEGACFYSWTPQEVMDAEIHNTFHRKLTKKFNQIRM